MCLNDLIDCFQFALTVIFHLICHSQQHPMIEFHLDKASIYKIVSSFIIRLALCESSVLFVTPQFAIFFMLVLSIYFILPHKWRWILLLLSSYYFYASWEVAYLGLIIFSTLVDYLAGYYLGKISQEKDFPRKLLLGLSLAVNLGVLFIFKYYNFFAGSMSEFLHIFGQEPDFLTLNVLLPVGVSFYTFQSMSYTIDIYRGKLQPETNFGIFATFIAFFPQLVAGPIERATNMLPQFSKEHDFDYVRVVEGFRLILWGAFKKVVIADRVAVVVNSVYTAPDQYSGLSLILATLFFSIQIYCDFSGYTDIAIGVARVMGYDLMLNFRQPYFAKSVQEFWQRWHISLSTWFRDYLYIPLGGNRASFGRYLLNIMIVFVVSGLWHGANWTFVIWGFLHGIMMVIEAITKRYHLTLIPRFLPSYIKNTLALISTFLLVSFAWIFFRAPDLSSAYYIGSHLFVGTGQNIISTYDGASLTSELQMMLTLVGIATLIVYDFIDARMMHKHDKSVITMMSYLPSIVRWGLYYVGLSYIIIAFVLSLNSLSDFIYFQF